ncbi:aminotransferase class V-fold PLP-dependent enzyme [Massilia sp. Se16.2.3]|uniref:aminotransferase class V-fold PLP-dependent enzyme n=1 Tax=Massilia sp. Se16.2.3 TaxID=2709303 RepID=UPI002805180C|nr:aminotransferase class V-fold PLP-dependent enzyme [Massilia sp. Se16.2.3]
MLEACGSGALWLVDCVQALGKLPLALERTRIDYAPFSGHKLYAPKGVGMLYVREGAPHTPLICGGGQEAGQRSGTENMAGIAALGAVLRALEEGAARSRRRPSWRLRARAWRWGCAPSSLTLSSMRLSSTPCRPRSTSRCRACPARRCSTCSTPPTCGSVRDLPARRGQAAPSHVLVAMGLPAWRCANAVRLSFGPLADDAFIDAACARIAHCGRALGAAPPPAQCATVDPVVPETGQGSVTALDRDELACFLDRHPGALLLDVREACEHAAGGAQLAGRATRNLPLSRLADEGEWLRDETRPLVFFCRSGKRSAQAARLALAFGQRRVWHLAGGLALLG